MQKLRVKAVVVPEFVEGEGRNFAERRLIQVVASAASHFEERNPIAQAICEYYDGAFLDASDPRELPGGGFAAVVAGSVLTVDADGEAYSGGDYIGRIETVSVAD